MICPCHAIQYLVVPYIGTWIETHATMAYDLGWTVVPYIGTWIETAIISMFSRAFKCRTLYRYVD